MEVSDIIRTLLRNRGIERDDDIFTFLKPDYISHTHAPARVHDMDRAVSRLLRAVQSGERVAVYADFDCDGIPGAALLHDFFRKIGHENFEVYIPHRDKEGYGFHADAIRSLANGGATLIVTVDVGTVATHGVEVANACGIDVIVTDHHEIIGGLPPAYAILNPKLGAYPFKDLCGAAVAWKLVCATLQEGKRQRLPAFEGIPDGWEKWLLDLVGIATIADMVPLQGENRALAHFGLQVLRKTQRAGLNALINALRLRREALSEDDIGFSLAPRINAASRMDEPALAFELLTTKDAARARDVASRLEELNAARKGVVSGIVRQAKKHLKARYTPADKVVVLGDTSWKPSLLGLAANSIMQERGGLVCLWGRDANGKLKGSCRSDGSVSLTEIFANGKDLFEESGGHAFSGGFSVSHEVVHTLPERLAQLCATLEEKEIERARTADLSLTLPEISSYLFSEVSRLAPFGTGNPKPLFLVSSTVVSSVKRFGKDNNHVEVNVQCSNTGISMRAFEFFKSPEDFSCVPKAGERARVLASVERDTFRGGLALRISDILEG